jgi:hypothetical protein
MRSVNIQRAALHVRDLRAISISFDGVAEA